MYITANKGDEVEILYIGKLKDQTVFDSTDEKGPFKFTIGKEISRTFSWRSLWQSQWKIGC
jgi:FKBP-type peptidyl-prolyl cis-trans isomerase